jgi:HSP20 family protein
MAMEPWEPFTQMMSLREAMDRLLQDTFVRPSSGWRPLESRPLALDVREQENDYKIEASLPGVKPEDVQIQVMGDTVTIRGESSTEREEKPSGNVLLRERRVGSFSRTFTLPMPVDAEHAQAHFEHGVLTLTLPKTEAAKPRRIPVQSARPEQQRENVPVDTGAPPPESGQSQEIPPVH